MISALLRSLGSCGVFFACLVASGCSSEAEPQLPPSAGGSATLGGAGGQAAVGGASGSTAGSLAAVAGSPIGGGTTAGSDAGGQAGAGGSSSGSGGAGIAGSGAIGGGGGTAGNGGTAADPLRVLLIGNSFTFYNDLDVMLQNMSDGGTPKILTKRLTTGGVTLKWHWDNDAQPAIQGGWAPGIPWSHVVLQGLSSESLNTDGTPAPASSDFQVYATKLSQAVKAVNAQPVFYETWAYRPCFAEFPAMWGGTPDKMQSGLLAAYTTAATNNMAWLAKVGEGWREVWTSHSEISLDKMYDPDCKHPAPWGTYLNASVIYVRLTGHAVPPSSAVPAGMSPQIAQTLQAIALQVGMP